MEIIGRGFIASSLRRLAADRPDVVAFATGASGGTSTSGPLFAAEAARLYEALVAATERGQRLLYFSTASAGLYGPVDGLAREDGPVAPQSPYGRHKLALEQVVRASGADYLVLRLTYPVGPGQRGHQLIPTLVRQVRSGVAVIHRGSYRDVLDAADMAAIVAGLLDAEVSRQTINVGSGVPVAVESLVEHLEWRLGVVVERELIDRVDSGAVSVAKLRRLVPAVDRLGFSADYYRRVLDRYLAEADHPTAE